MKQENRLSYTNEAKTSSLLNSHHLAVIRYRPISVPRNSTFRRSSLLQNLLMLILTKYLIVSLYLKSRTHQKKQKLLETMKNYNSMGYSLLEVASRLYSIALTLSKLILILQESSGLSKHSGNLSKVLTTMTQLRLWPFRRQCLLTSQMPLKHLPHHLLPTVLEMLSSFMGIHR